MVDHDLPLPHNSTTPAFRGPSSNVPEVKPAPAIRATRNPDAKPKSSTPYDVAAVFEAPVQPPNFAMATAKTSEDDKQPDQVARGRDVAPCMHGNPADPIIERRRRRNAFLG